MLTEVKSVEGTIYLIDEDNNIHSVKCSYCGEVKTPEEMTNIKKGICAECGKDVDTDELEALDEEMKGLLAKYWIMQKVQHTVQLESSVSKKLDNLQARYGRGFKSALVTKIVENAIEQIEVEYDLDLSRKLPRSKGAGVV